MSVVRHTELRTSNTDEATQMVSQLFCNHTLVPQGERGSGVELTLRADELGPLGIVHLDYGTPVKIRPDPLAEFYLVQIPKGGYASIVQDHQRVMSHASTASVLSPTGQVSMSWGTHTPQLCVYLPRSLVEGELSLLVGQSIDKPLVFDLAMPLQESGSAAFLRSVLFLADELRWGTSLLQRRELVESFASTLAGQLLTSQPNNYSHLFLSAEPINTTMVQRAVDFIEEHIGDHSLTVAKISRELGVSVRSLQEAFRKELSTSPLSYIKSRRMNIAHRRLRAGDPRLTTVTRVAADVGVTHLGRFSVEYRELFGVPPSVTLAATR